MLRRIVLLLFFAACVFASSSSKPNLKFNSNNKFRILQFADMHFGENATKDKATQQMQRDLINWEKPDLVLLSGDQVSNYAFGTMTSCFAKGSKECWNYAVETIEGMGYPWMATFGNHDYVPDLTAEQLMAIDVSHALSYSQMGPKNVSHEANYVLNIRNTDDTSDAFRIWSLDSGGGSCLDVSGWDCVRPDQIEWYRATMETLNKGRTTPVPAMAVLHIPLPEYLNMFNHRDYYNVSGMSNETICCSSVNTGLFSAFKEMGDVTIVTVGHDHENDYIGNYNGVTLSYGRKTGYGGYFGDGTRGARVFEFTLASNGTVTMDTWIRERTGTVVFQKKMDNGNTVTYEACCSSKGLRDTMFWEQETSN